MFKPLQPPSTTSGASSAQQPPKTATPLDTNKARHRPKVTPTLKRKHVNTAYSKPDIRMTEDEMNNAVWRKRRAGDDRQPIKYKPQIWWESEYKRNPAAYYRQKYLSHTSIFCSECDNRYCGWHTADIDPILDTGRCRYCNGEPIVPVTLVRPKLDRITVLERAPTLGLEAEGEEIAKSVMADVRAMEKEERAVVVAAEAAMAEEEPSKGFDETAAPDEVPEVELEDDEVPDLLPPEEATL